MEVCDYCLCLKGGFPFIISHEQVSPETRDLSVFVATIAVQSEPQPLLARQSLKEAVVDPGKLVPATETQLLQPQGGFPFPSLGRLPLLLDNCFSVSTEEVFKAKVTW